MKHVCEFSLEILSITCLINSQLTTYINLVKEEKCKEKVEFFCVLKIMPRCVFNKKDLIVVGVNVIVGVAKVWSWNTSLCAPSWNDVDIDKIVSMEVNHIVVNNSYMMHFIISHDYFVDSTYLLLILNLASRFIEFSWYSQKRVKFYNENCSN
jgi:hypothetical protein